MPPALEEITISFATADGLQLEGRLYLPHSASQQTLSGRAVICHPHPLMGGTLDNKVVEIMTRALGEAGYATLRFNFRSVGESEGDYGGGHDEVADVVGALHHLDQIAGFGERVLAGFSFGSLLAAGAAKGGEAVDRLLLVGMPLNRWCTYPPLPRRRLTMIVGDEDEFCTVEKAQAYIAHLSDLLPDGAQGERLQLSVIPQASHFFHGRLSQLAVAVKAGLEHS